MVGLTGGIASGKSYVRELLKDKGAFVLDCDALGHLSYIQGTPTYQAMIAAFGDSIVNPGKPFWETNHCSSILAQK